MNNKPNFSGSALITDEGIKKHFKSAEPVRAIFELIYNGLDANASMVDVKTRHNGLDGLESITVVDNGDGIDIPNLHNSFKKFNESSKRSDDDKHGSHGKGRLAFHRLCGHATWYTRRDGYDAKIEIDSAAVKDYEGGYLEKKQQHALLHDIKSGTCVELTHFQGSSLPTEEQLFDKLNVEFGWYLAINKARQILVNGIPIVIPSHDLHEREITASGIDFCVKVVRWDDKPSSEKSFNYLVDKHNKVIKKTLSKFNNKPNFYVSANVYSDWLDGYDPDDLAMSPEHVEAEITISKLTKLLTEFQREIYNNFLRKFADSELERFEKNGYFPDYKGVDKTYAEWRKGNTKSVIKEIYVADPSVFNNLNKKQAKIIVRLIDAILVSNENDSLFDVLDGVLDLNGEAIDLFAKQLSKTTLENIVSTIESLQKRQHAVQQLREIMDNRHQEVLETPDLQKIIENNTWLFGPQYATLGAEEDGFQSISRNLRDEIKDIDIINDQDLADGADIEGINKQVDLFLARKVPSINSAGKHFFKCAIVEIKRPGVSLNKKHLRQLEDYAEIIERHPAFGSDSLQFELILIGRKISNTDVTIRSNLNTLKDRMEPGLVSDSGTIKSYVRDWYSIFDEFELTNNYLLETLSTKRDDLSGLPTEELVLDLQGVAV